MAKDWSEPSLQCYVRMGQTGPSHPRSSCTSLDSWVPADEMQWVAILCQCLHDRLLCQPFYTIWPYGLALINVLTAAALHAIGWWDKGQVLVGMSGFPVHWGGDQCLHWPLCTDIQPRRVASNPLILSQQWTEFTNQCRFGGIGTCLL